MQKFLIYFVGSGVIGLLIGFVILQIIPKPKNKKSREELADFILRATTATSIAIGIYFFAQN